MSSTSSVRILIADDHPVIREGLAAVIANRAEMCIVAEAGSGAEAVTLYRRHLPDVTLMDTRMPNGNGLDALDTIHKEYPQARIIMLSTFDAQDDIYRAFRAGAKSYLLKDIQSAELFHAISQVAAGHIYMPAHISSQIAERMRAPELTAREGEVLTHLVTGKSNQEIGSKLFIAEGTVKVHVSNILTKLRAHDRTQAVTMALRRGLAHLD